MTFLSKSNEDDSILHGFFSISQWESLVSILIFFGLMIGLYFLIRKTKMRFMFRVLIALGIGLVFGVVIQGINGFPFDSANPSNNLTNPLYPDPENPGEFLTNPIYKMWVEELAIWIELLKQVFIRGVLLLTVPIVFLAIAKAVAKQHTAKGTGKGTAITITFLLVNVSIAFIIALTLGMVFKIGNGFEIVGEGDYAQEASKPLPALIYGYVSDNLFGTFVAGAIIPVMVIGALLGYAVKKSSKRHQQEMDNVRHGFERWWTIVMSILTVFIKLMPYAVMSMIANAIITRPIGYLSQIGIVIGVAYLALTIMLMVFTAQMPLFGINPVIWWKKGYKILIQGFATQSSNATLPVSMEILRDEMKVKEGIVGLSTPLSSSMGLAGCAGVQSGIIVSFISTAGLYEMNPTNFIIALIVTVIASLGIAGVPGTAAVVTAGVLGGLGFSALYGPVYSIIGALDGIFDMGRTGVNVTGGALATTVAGKLTGNIEGDELFLKRKAKIAKIKKPQEKIKEKNQKKDSKKDN